MALNQYAPFTARLSPLVFLVMVLVCSLGLGLRPAHAADAVTEWSEFAISSRLGDYHWHSVVLMNAAMHDTLNAVRPRYARWIPASAGEPAAAGATPEAAVAAAAHAVLAAGRPDHREAIDAMLTSVLAAIPDSPGKSAGVALGESIAAAVGARRASDREVRVYPFPSGTAPGVWRPTPPFFRTAMTARLTPFAFSVDEPAPLPPPPALGSAAYVEAVAEVRELGARQSARRTAAQTSAALFFADQSSQRNFQALALRVLAARPPPHDLWESARTMALLSFAMTDSGFLAWAAKERFAFWRPITAIREGGFGVEADSGWSPLVSTPAHPDHPSGHASDCSTGANLLRRLFGPDTQAVRYIATDSDGSPGRDYPAYTALARECAESRLWAGVHFRTANDAGLVLGEAIAERVVSTMLRPLPER